LVGLAVNVTEEPAQMLVALAAIDTPGVTFDVTVIFIEFEVAVLLV
jgi:hypothetical protein